LKLKKSKTQNATAHAYGAVNYSDNLSASF